MLSLLALLVCSYSLHAQKTPKVWKVILVASSSEPNISAGVEQFLEDAQIAFNNAGKILDLPVEITVVKGREVNPKRLSVLRETLLQAQEQPAMLTWMSFTHGFNTVNNQSDYPYLVAHPTKTVLSNTEMRYAFSLESFYQDLLESGNYASVHLWAELCNQICKSCSSPKTQGLASLSSAGSQRILEDVLLKPAGSLMVSSAYGQESCSSVAGGPFSRAIFEVLKMAELGEWQPNPRQPTASFMEMVQEMSKHFLQELPESACQTQQPMGKASR